MASEHPTIGVQLIDHDVSEVLEQLGPPRMMRQNPGVQHVGIAQHDVRATPDRAPRVLRGVSVVGIDPDGHTLTAEPCGQRLQLGELVLCERLGWEQVEGPMRRIVERTAFRTGTL